MDVRLGLLWPQLPLPQWCPRDGKSVLSFRRSAAQPPGTLCPSVPWSLVCPERQQESAWRNPDVLLKQRSLHALWCCFKILSKTVSILREWISQAVVGFSHQVVMGNGSKSYPKNWAFKVMHHLWKHHSLFWVHFRSSVCVFIGSSMCFGLHYRWPFLFPSRCFSVLQSFTTEFDKWLKTHLVWDLYLIYS